MKVNDEPWEHIAKAVSETGYELGKNVFFATDPAVSEIAAYGEDNTMQYHLEREGKVLSSEDLILYFADWVNRYYFVSVEDILAEDDWENWTKATARIGSKVRIVGDDLLVTNPVRLQRAIDEKACNAILIKLNQIGSLSETIQTIELAHRAGFWTIVSHRGGGETNDTAMIDLAVACGCEMVKVGIARGERTEKYNRLMEIEDMLRG